MKTLSLVLPSSIALACVLGAGGACTVTTSSGGDDGGPDAATSGTDSAVEPDANPPTPGDDAAGDASPTSDVAISVDAGPLGFTPSNLGTALAGIDVSKLVDIDVTGAMDQAEVDCNSQSAGACVSMKVSESGGASIVYYFAKSWKIEPNAVLFIKDATPVVLVALETINVLGRIDAGATQSETVAGGFQGNAGGTAGGAGAGASGINSNASTAGIGAGGGSYCGLGGAGGQSNTTNGGAGKAYGSPTLVPLAGGSAGGVGDLASGAGGGALQLVAGTSIVVASGGLVVAGGGGGSDGSGGYAASGGGSGGALLFEAPMVTVSGTLAVNGGGGGGGAGAPSYAADATPNATPAAGGAPATTGVGGNGGAGATVNGTAGGAGDPAGGTNVPGAGGGGAGYIRINTSSGTATIAGTLTPAVGSACVSQGTLSP
jgi:hypothetical protein